MDDLIKRQDAISVLNAKCKKAFNLTCGEEDCACAEYMALRDLPSAQQWIPCSERLPEPWTSVLVTYIYNGKRFVEESQYTGQDDERGNPLFSSYADEYKVSNAYFQKIAWMPLPEPYREETES